MTLLNSVFAHVCGVNKITYESHEIAHALNIAILHCGPCGKCSNMNDAGVYYETRQTMTGIATKCAALKVLSLGSRSVASRCMKNNGARLTPGCMDCWMDNMECTKTNCFRICSLYASTGNEEYRLKCLECDEQFCGPNFKLCAGLTRRGAGMISDIDRKSEEICTVMDCDWSLPESNPNKCAIKEPVFKILAQ